MSAVTTDPMKDWDDLSPAEREVVEMLRNGRVTAPFVAEETGYNTQYIREVLADLADHDHAEKVYSGLYELTNDPED